MVIFLLLHIYLCDFLPYKCAALVEEEKPSVSSAKHNKDGLSRTLRLLLALHLIASLIVCGAHTGSVVNLLLYTKHDKPPPHTHKKLSLATRQSCVT